MECGGGRGGRVMMETPDEWCVSTQVRAVVERVDHPNLRVLWDLMHTQRFMERPEHTMRTIGHLTAHLHAHDGRYQTPAGPLENGLKSRPIRLPAVPRKQAVRIPRILAASFLWQGVRRPRKGRGNSYWQTLLGPAFTPGERANEECHLSAPFMGLFPRFAAKAP